MKHKKTYIISIGIALAVGGVSALLTRSSMERFAALEQPPLSPPGVVFPIVWTILFILMGISAARVWLSRDADVPNAIYLYGAQLFVNFFWSIFFFNLEIRLLAFFWLLLLLGLVLAMTVRFWRIDRLAGYLQLPYIAWLLFAAYLNMGVYLLNR